MPNTRIHRGLLGLVILVVVAAGLYLVLPGRAATLPGDVNQDGAVNITDLSMLIARWSTNDAAADFNSDGKVNVFDLSALLANWGKTATPSPSPTPTSPSGQAMPVGDLPGWRQIVAEDFKTTATAATFDATYPATWCGYDDGTGGKYYKIISAHDGVQDFVLDGVKGAAGAYGVRTPNSYCGSLYGRYSIRFKVEGASGYGAALMLWPNSNVWGDGEIDYPEGNFDSTMHVFHHGVGCGNSCGSADGLDTGVGWRAWHTATTEWTPDSVKYYLDGALIKTVTHDIPINSHRMTIQMAPTANPALPGHFVVDWVSIWAKN